VRDVDSKKITAPRQTRSLRDQMLSQNFSVASLDYNRELGVRTTSPAVIAALSSALTHDYAGATPYSP
jgi:hypothetical protein